MARYYLDTCIWRDYFENRSDRFRPLGEWAFQFLRKIIDDEDLIFYSNVVENELAEFYSAEKISEIFSIVPKELLIRVNASSEQLLRSHILSKKLGIPRNDVTHFILARDNHAVLVSRDAHLAVLGNLVKKPEELL